MQIQHKKNIFRKKIIFSVVVQQFKNIECDFIKLLLVKKKNNSNSAAVPSLISYRHISNRYSLYTYHKS